MTRGQASAAPHMSSIASTLIQSPMRSESGRKVQTTRCTPAATCDTAEERVDGLGVCLVAVDRDVPARVRSVGQDQGAGSTARHDLDAIGLASHDPRAAAASCRHARRARAEAQPGRG